MPSNEAGVFDLAIIGGGINGCGIARDAVGRGWSVYLCEANDLGSATSSSSTKLVHGGLRYLEHREFRLVREALMEREVLWSIAPHIIWPLRFVLPHHEGLRPAWLLRLGLLMYDHLGGRKLLPPTRTINLRADPTGQPLKTHDTASGERGTIQARALVNAAGPWVGNVLQSVVRSNTPGRVRMVKGSHIVVRRLYPGEQCYIFQNADGRIFFVIPYERDFSLIGTTDLDYQGDPADAHASADEIAYLCAGATEYLAKPVTPEQVVWTYSGVRPLYDDGATKAQAATRDYVLDLDAPDGSAALLSVFGGKITTFRRLAEAALAKLGPHLPKPATGLDAGWTGAAALPGGDFPVDGFDAELAWLGARQVTRLRFGQVRTEHRPERRLRSRVAQQDGHAGAVSAQQAVQRGGRHERVARA